MHYFQKAIVGILAVLFFIQCGSAATPDERKMEGVWAAKLGDLGYIALDYSGAKNGQKGPSPLWWFVESLGLQCEFDGTQLKTYYRDHKNEERLAFVFTFVEGRGFQLEAGGLLPSPLPAPFAGVSLAKMPPDTWYNLTNNYYKTSQWGIWHEEGSLKELPANWPTALAESTVRLFSGRLNELVRALAVPTLSKEALAEAYRRTIENPSRNDGRESIQRAIAANPGCDLATLKELWQIPEAPVVWYTAARNPNAPKEWLEGFAERILKSSALVQMRVLYNNELPSEVIEQLAERASAEAFSGIVRHPKVTAHSLEIICKRMKTERGSGPYLWEELAANPKAPIEFLLETAETAIKSKHDRCLAALASNPTLPADVHKAVAEARFRAVFVDGGSPYNYGTGGPLADPYLAPSHVIELIDLPLPNVRLELAQNPSLSDVQLKQLAADPVSYVSRAAVAAWRKRYPAGPELVLPAGAGKKNSDGPAELREMIFGGRVAEAAAVWRKLPKNQRVMLGQVVYWGKEMDRLHPILEFIAAVDPKGGDLAESLLAELVRSAPEQIAEMKKRGVLGNVRAYSAFEQALSLRKPETVQVLLEAELDANAKGEGDRTPLMMATLLGDVESVKLLLKHGAMVQTKDRNSRRAVDYAFQALKPDVMVLLVETADDKARLKKLQDQLSPAAAGSPFVGHWTNGKDGFYTVIVQLHDNGSFVFAGGMLSLRGKWKTQGADRVIANPIWPEETEFNSPQQREELAKLKTAFRELVFVRTSNPERLQLTKPDGTSIGDPLVRERP